jgi:ABC-type transport system involved in multi-copper enzyme maturation permease subunit
MSYLSKILAVCAFEFRRSMTFGRLTAFFVLTLFPPVMVLLVSRVSSLSDFRFLVILLTFIVSALALLLWATPNVYSELESRNWTFLTSRPDGRVALVLGKYLAASISAITVSLGAISISLLIVIATQARHRPDVLREIAEFAPKIAVLAVVACLEYAAAFSLIGVFFQRRAMVVGAIYAVGFEIFVGSVPAIISKFTIRYHLVAIAITWFGWFLPGRAPDEDVMIALFKELPLWANIAALVAIPIAAMAATMYICRYREYITVDEV